MSTRADLHIHSHSHSHSHSSDFSSSPSLTPTPSLSTSTSPSSSPPGSSPGSVTSILSSLKWVLIWFCLNVSLAILNKSVFSFTPFTYPVLLSTIHMISVFILSNVFRLFFRGSASSNEEGTATNDDESGPKPANPGVPEEAKPILRMFVLLFCLNIAFGNMSIRIVNLPLSQMLRSTMPVWTLILSLVFLPRGRTPVKWYILLTLIPVMLGVAIVAIADAEFSLFSAVIIFIGIILCATKTVFTNLQLTRFKIDPISMLAFLSPYAAVVMFVLACLFGEVGHLIGVLRGKIVLDPPPKFGWVGGIVLPVITGIVAYFLNWTNFLANRSTSPLTMSVGGNVKQALSVFLSVYIFSTEMNIRKIIGFVVAFLGMFAYTFAKNRLKKEKEAEKARKAAPQGASGIIDGENDVVEQDGPGMVVVNALLTKLRGLFGGRPPRELADMLTDEDDFEITNVEALGSFEFVGDDEDDGVQEIGDVV